MYKIKKVKNQVVNCLASSENKKEIDRKMEGNRIEKNGVSLADVMSWCPYEKRETSSSSKRTRAVLIRLSKWIAG